MKIKIKTLEFIVSYMPEDFFLRYQQNPNTLIGDHYDIKEQVIYINSSLPEHLQNYSLFHAIWEILAALSGKDYSCHEYFQLFSLDLFEIILENNLGGLFNNACSAN